MKKSIPDISVVMNAHRAVLYYEKTIKSLEEAAKYAISYGIVSELVVVLDSPDQETINWFENYQTNVFSSYRIIRVSYGSLGESRNAGVKVSTGRYIMTYDDDDLISYNYIKSMYGAVSDLETGIVVFPEYLFSFGDGRQLCRYHTFPKLSRLAFLEAHALTSRLLASRDVFEKISYLPVKIGDAFSFEDWHFNCEVIANEFEIRIADSAILFYRERMNGSAWAMTHQGTGQIPYSSLFHPNTYGKICRSDYERYKTGENNITPACDIISSFVSNMEVRKQVENARQIDGAINFDCIEEIFAHTNKDRALELGAAYFDICKFVADIDWTDIIIADFDIFHKSSNVMKQIQAKSSKRNMNICFLVIMTQKPAPETIFGPNKDGIYFLSVGNLLKPEISEMSDFLILKLLQSYSDNRNLHLFISKFTIRFFDKYHSATDGMKRSLYYRSGKSEEGYIQNIGIDEANSFARRHFNRFVRFMTNDRSLLNMIEENVDKEKPIWKSIETISFKFIVRNTIKKLLSKNFDK